MQSRAPRHAALGLDQMRHDNIRGWLNSASWLAEQRLVAEGTASRGWLNSDYSKNTSCGWLDSSPCGPIENVKSDESGAPQSVYRPIELILAHWRRSGCISLTSYAELNSMPTS